MNDFIVGLRVLRLEKDDSESAESAPSETPSRRTESESDGPGSLGGRECSPEFLSSS